MRRVNGVSQPFPDIRFTGQLRNSQREVVEIARRQLDDGRRRLHVIAPPGSGKTVLGLYLWAELIRRPAWVLSPNSAIQAQWAARTDLFAVGDSRQPLTANWVSTEAGDSALLTSLTYQSVTLPQRDNDDWDQQARSLWIERLIAKRQAQDPDEAEVWLNDLQTHNRDYYDQRLARYRKQVRDGLAAEGRSLDLLHASSQEALQAAGAANIGLLILDECHHLVGHWGRVLQEASERLGDPIVVGLTATPPDIRGKSSQDVRQYQTLLGEVDFEVPVPAVVKDGFLAPYQDLVQFTRPTSQELNFVSDVDQAFRNLLSLVSDTTHDTNVDTDGEGFHRDPDQDAGAPRSLLPWVVWTLAHRQLPQGPQPDWRSFEKRDPTFAESSRQLLLTLGIPLPDGVPGLTLDSDLRSLQRRIQREHQTVNSGVRSTASAATVATASALHSLPLPLLTSVLDRYIRHRLRRSSDPQDQQLAESLIARLRTLGIQITESGFQSCASPVSRVLAYSRSKALAMVRILRQEQQVMGDRLRAVVVTDYERTSAVEAEISQLLDEQAGGAIAAFREILACPETNSLDPILLTGSTVLVDQDLWPSLQPKLQDWLQQRGLQVELHTDDQGAFVQVSGGGRDWCPRVYVTMLTQMFQDGVTRCLVGTRGLLGEGWDASRANVLVDLTTVTTSMSINQLRGRSIRLDDQWKNKVANNWDVVCVAPEFTKGFDDFVRFQKKHESLFGLTDDGQIEKGAGHVHPVFQKIQPEELELAIDPINRDMLDRAGRRAACRDGWKIGQPYHGELNTGVEIGGQTRSGTRHFPAVGWFPEPWTDHSLAQTLGQVVYRALRELKKIDPGNLEVGQRQNESVRVLLTRASPEDAERFAIAISELLGPLDEARYMIPREVSVRQGNWLSRWFPEYVARWLESRQRKIVMWHRVPTELAGHQSEVRVFEKHWNRIVGRGQAVFTYRGRGRQQMEDVLESGMVPTFEVHTSQIFQ